MRCNLNSCWRSKPAEAAAPLSDSPPPLPKYRYPNGNSTLYRIPADDATQEQQQTITKSLSESAPKSSPHGKSAQENELARQNLQEIRKLAQDFAAEQKAKSKPVTGKCILCLT